jgi:hypothetical protein
MAAADLDTINSTQNQGVQYLGLIYKALLAQQSLNLVPVPATATSPGTAGQVAASAGFLYVCVADAVWRRVAIAAF